MKNSFQRSLLKSTFTMTVIAFTVTSLILPPSAFPLAPATQKDNLLKSVEKQNLLEDMYSEFRSGQGSLTSFRDHPAWEDTFEHSFYSDGTLFVPVLDNNGPRYFEITGRQIPKGTQLTLFDFEKGLLGGIKIVTRGSLTGDENERDIWEKIAKKRLLETNKSEFQELDKETKRKDKIIESVRRSLLFAYKGNYEKLEDFYKSLHKARVAPFKGNTSFLKELAMLRMASNRSYIQSAAIPVLNLWERYRAFDQPSLKYYLQHLAEGDSKMARAYLGRNIYPTLPDYGIYSGYILTRMADWDKARDEFLNSLRKDPNNVHAWNLLALALENLNEPGKALWIRNYISEGHVNSSVKTVETIAKSLNGVDVFSDGTPIDASKWEYDRGSDIYRHEDGDFLNLAQRISDGRFVPQGGTRLTKLQKKLVERDRKIQSELDSVQNTSLDRKLRIDAAKFLNEYLAPTPKGRKKLEPIIRKLTQELRDIESQLDSDTIDSDTYLKLTQGFLDQLDIMSRFATPTAAEELVDYIVSGPPDIHRGYATRALAEKFQEGWPTNLMTKDLILKIRMYMKNELLPPKVIAEALNDENMAETAFFNLSKTWEVTRNPEMIDFFIDVVEQDNWKVYTSAAATALRNSWNLFGMNYYWKPRGTRPRRADQWIKRLEKMVFDENNKDIIKKSMVIGALAGVKEESRGTNALVSMLDKDKFRQRRGNENKRYDQVITPYLRLKAIETLSIYAKRGDISTLSKAGKIGREELLIFLKNVVDLLNKDKFQIGLGLQLPGEEAPTLNVVDVTELFGSLLSVIIRDDHAQGKEWDKIQKSIPALIDKIHAADQLDSQPPPMVEFVEQGTKRVTTLQEFFQVQDKGIKALEAKKPKLYSRPKEKGAPRSEESPNFVREHRISAFPLYEYYGVTNVFGKKMVKFHKPYLNFLKGLFADISLLDFERSDFAKQPAGQFLKKQLKEDLGPFRRDILKAERVVEDVSKARRAYGLETWIEVINTMKRFKKRHDKGIKSNPYAKLLWQRDMIYLVVSAFLDEWDIDSPKSRPYTRIKLLHATDILPKDAYKLQFEDNAGVTVDDRWIFLPDTVFQTLKLLDWDVTTIAHEDQHWLRGSDDIAMLGAAVLYGLDQEINFLKKKRQVSPRPLELVLNKMREGKSLTQTEKKIISKEFQEGFHLAFDIKVRSPKDGILQIFENFKWPVNDWPWDDIVYARQLLPGEIVVAYTSEGEEYRHTDTYMEGAKLAGYLMGLSIRAGGLQSWQLFAELLAKQPEKYKGAKRGRLNPAEVYCIVYIINGLAKTSAANLRAITNEIENFVTNYIESRKLQKEEQPLIRKRISKKIEEVVKKKVMDIKLDENSTYKMIRERAKNIITTIEGQLVDLSNQMDIAEDVIADITRARPVPFASSLLDNLDRTLSPATPVKASM